MAPGDHAGRHRAFARMSKEVGLDVEGGHPDTCGGTAVDRTRAPFAWLARRMYLLVIDGVVWPR